jgi:hypothetical protein
MTQLQVRLAEAAATLDKIESTRAESRNPSFGENTERLLIAREIAELERNILEDPGDLERFLVRLR